jgi:hypothetical protein
MLIWKFAYQNQALIMNYNCYTQALIPHGQRIQFPYETVGQTTPHRGLLSPRFQDHHHVHHKLENFDTYLMIMMKNKQCDLQNDLQQKFL